MVNVVRDLTENGEYKDGNDQAFVRQILHNNLTDNLPSNLSRTAHIVRIVIHRIDITHDRQLVIVVHIDAIIVHLHRGAFSFERIFMICVAKYKQNKIRHS